jgi:hypothetical protein
MTQQISLTNWNVLQVGGPDDGDDLMLPGSGDLSRGDPGYMPPFPPPPPKMHGMYFYIVFILSVFLLVFFDLFSFFMTEINFFFFLILLWLENILYIFFNYHSLLLFLFIIKILLLLFIIKIILILSSESPILGAGKKLKCYFCLFLVFFSYYFIFQLGVMILICVGPQRV